MYKCEALMIKLVAFPAEYKAVFADNRTTAEHNGNFRDAYADPRAPPRRRTRDFDYDTYEEPVNRRGFLDLPSSSQYRGDRSPKQRRLQRWF